MDPAQLGAPTTGRSALYVGGRIYPTNANAEKDIDELRQSTFGTIFIWSIHVETANPDKGWKDGDLVYNDVPIISEGRYIGDSRWPALLERLKRASGATSAKRVEVSVGAGEVDDWKHIRDLVDEHGTGPDSVLYRNFETLLRVTKADALNSDNEDCYDVDSAVAFAGMLKSIGYGDFTFTPWDEEGYWRDLKSALGEYVSRAYIQCYSGGEINADADRLKHWSRELGGMPLDPGLWCKHKADEKDTRCRAGDSPDDMKKKLKGWIDEGAPITGGFVWLHDDIKTCEQANPHCTVAAYANAVNEATKKAPAHA